MFKDNLFWKLQYVGDINLDKVKDSLYVTELIVGPCKLFNILSVQFSNSIYLYITTKQQSQNWA